MATVLLIFGGWSPEQEISILSALEIAPLISEAGHKVVAVYVSSTGVWHAGDDLLRIQTYQTRGFAKLPLVHLAPVGDRFVLRSTDSATSQTPDVPVDLVFPVFHGVPGEDGTIQGMCEFLRIPYVGSNTIASAIGMDKVVQKALFRESGLPVLPSAVVTLRGWQESRSLKRLIELSFPLILKPARLGSSIGIKVARDEAELMTAMDEALRYDTKILVEHFVQTAVEINCAVIGGENSTASLCERPLAKNSFLSFEDKYVGPQQTKMSKSGLSVAAATNQSERSAGFANRVFPADIDQKLAAEISMLACRAFDVIEADGVARVDFLVVGGEPFINEINTIPGSLGIHLWSGGRAGQVLMLDAMVKRGLQRFTAATAPAAPRPHLFLEPATARLSA